MADPDATRLTGAAWREEAQRQHDEFVALCERIRKEDRKIMLESATFSALATRHFKDSCILQEPLWEATNRYMQLKAKLIQLLELELKARQWYGPDMPAPYFCNVGLELLQAIDNDDLFNSLYGHVDHLQCIMFALSEQKGGAPLAFREAYDAATATVGHDDVERETVQPVAAAVVVVDLTDE